MKPTKSFLEEIHEQRWDDHRFYHRSRVNQTLHLLSALCFLACYVLLPINPSAAALFGWLVAMWPRQIGHFWFEPKGFDEINQVTFDQKESVKVGFNLHRKVLLFCSWLSIPVVLRLSPSVFGLVEPWTDDKAYLHRLGLVWLAFAGIALMARTLWLCVNRGIQTGVAWFVKILTDPFHDVWIYHGAPLRLLKGEWLDPMEEVREATAHAARARQSATP